MSETAIAASNRFSLERAEEKEAPDGEAGTLFLVNVMDAGIVAEILRLDMAKVVAQDSCGT